MLYSISLLPNTPTKLFGMYKKQLTHTHTISLGSSSYCLSLPFLLNNNHICNGTPEFCNTGYCTDFTGTDSSLSHNVVGNFYSYLSDVQFIVVESSFCGSE